MPTDTPATRTETSKGPGNSHVGPTGIAVSLLLVMAFSVTLLYTLVVLMPREGAAPEARAGADTALAAPISRKLSPPGGAVAFRDTAVRTAASPAPDSTRTNHETADGAAKNASDSVTWFSLRRTVPYDRRLFLITLLAGALGATVHMLRSVGWYVGHRDLKWSWLAYYLSLPLVGALLAGSFYMIVRGGFFPEHGDSPYGFAALGVLIGMFNTPAALKLKEIAETVLSRPIPGADTAQPQSGSAAGDAAITFTPSAHPTIATVDRERRAAGAAADALLITGTGFAATITAQVGGRAHPVRFVSDSLLSLPLGDEDLKVIDAGGDFVITVENPGGRPSQPFDFA